MRKGNADIERGKWLIKKIIPMVVIVTLVAGLFAASCAPEKEEALPKSITIVDSAGTAVEVPQPLERIAVWDPSAAEVIRALGAGDKIIGISDSMTDPMYADYWPELQDRPTISSWHEPDYEKVIDVEPQVIFTIVGYPSDAEEALEPAGIKVIRMRFNALGTITANIRTLGTILQKENEAEEFVNFLQQKLDLIEARVKEMEPEARKRVYFEAGHRDYFSWGPGSVADELITKAGGINIFADLDVSGSEVDPEEILVRELDVVIKDNMGVDYGGYNATSTSDIEAKRDEMMSRPGWRGLGAVSDGQVYIQGGELFGPKIVMNLGYIAKILYPDRFNDLDVESFHREYLEKYQGLEFKGIYLYPCPWQAE
jgi:iron complex transport system substrate-binding protein